MLSCSFFGYTCKISLNSPAKETPPSEAYNVQILLTVYQNGVFNLVFLSLYACEYQKYITSLERKLLVYKAPKVGTTAPAH